RWPSTRTRQWREREPRLYQHRHDCQLWWRRGRKRQFPDHSRGCDGKRGNGEWRIFGGLAHINITSGAQVLGPAGGTLVNTATVNASNESPDEQNDSSTATITIQPAGTQTPTSLTQTVVSAPSGGSFTVVAGPSGTLSSFAQAGAGNPTSAANDAAEPGAQAGHGTIYGDVANMRNKVLDAIFGSGDFADGLPVLLCKAQARFSGK